MSMCGDLQTQLAAAQANLAMAQTTEVGAELDFDGQDVLVDALEAQLAIQRNVLMQKQQAWDIAKAAVQMYQSEINYCQMAILMNNC